MNPKKTYSIDNGFSYCNSISFSKDRGKMLENMVFLHLRARHKEIFYFKESGECDFVIKEKEKASSAIQVCLEMNQENMNREIKGLIAALKRLRLREGTILTYNQSDHFNIDGKKITVKPVWKWMIEE